MVVAIDGPAGAGKRTVARELARAPSFSYLGSGAMYRAIALSLTVRPGTPPPRPSNGGSTRGARPTG